MEAVGKERHLAQLWEQVCGARTFLAPQPSARGAVQLAHASDHMIPEERIKIALAPGQTAMESVLLLAHLERPEAKDERGSERRS